MDEAVIRLPRLVLPYLVIAIMTIALVSTPWHGMALTIDPGSCAQDTQGGHEHAMQVQAGQQHTAPAKSHAAGQGCCHPVCTVALIPPSIDTAQTLQLSAVVRIGRDLEPAPGASVGLDRPPKRA